MVSQNHLDISEDKELKKQKETIMKLLVGLPFSTMPLHSHNQLTFEIATTTTLNTLIPRNTVTNIFVFPCFLNADGYMELHRISHDNIQHNTRANGATTFDKRLHKAASHGDIIGAQEAVQSERGLLRLVEPERKNLPLHTAVKHGHKEVALYLVKEYPQGSYALNSSGKSPLYYAVQRKDLDLVKNMLCKLDKDDKTILSNLDKGKSIVHLAIGDKNREMVETILKYQPKLIKCADEEGLTPLSFAASKGFVGIASYIVKKYPESMKTPNKDKTKSLPVHKAALGGHVDVLKMFHATNPNSLLSRDGQGQTILHLAAKKAGNKLKNVVSYLLSLNVGAKLIRIKDENERYPLDLAKNYGNGEVENIIKSSMPN